MNIGIPYRSAASLAMNIKSLIYPVVFLFLISCSGQTTSESKNEQLIQTPSSNSAMTREILKISDLIGKDLQEAETILGKADKIDYIYVKANTK